MAGAFAFGTVLPVRAGGPFGRGALTALPVVGIALGDAGRCGDPLAWHGLVFGARQIHWPACVGVSTVLIVATRGMHIDGMADTTDGARLLRAAGAGAGGDARRDRGTVRVWPPWWS